MSDRREVCSIPPLPPPPPGDLLAQGEGEGVRHSSDRVLCLHVSHVLRIGVADGHHPVTYTDTSLSGLASWGQLEEKEESSVKKKIVQFFTDDVM